LGNSALGVTYAMIEPRSCLLAAQDRIKDRIPTAENVLIVGADFVGVAQYVFVSLNIKMSARHVFMANRSEEKLNFAIARGVIKEGNPLSRLHELSAGEGVDIVK
jgi:threonine dehydrogenase-like Zn-dependent dehydrogenase